MTPNPFNCNLGGDALRGIRAILFDEQKELARIESLSTYAPAKAAGCANIAKVEQLIKHIDIILKP